MSTVGNQLQVNGVVDDFDDLSFIDLVDEETIEESLVQACVRAESVSKQPEQELKPTQIIDISDDKIDSKMEFNCSSECLVEPNMDYSLDDVIEICSIASEDDEDSVEEVLSTMLTNQRAKNDTKLDEDNAGKSKSLKQDDDHNEEFLTVFNDHNYTSQEITTPANDANQDLRQNIIDHIVKKRSLEANNIGAGNCEDDASSHCSSDSVADKNAIKEIEDFVDQILEGKIEEFVGKNVRIKTELNSEAIHTEDFVQNVFYAVADEDAADYAAEASLSNRSHKAAVSEIHSEKSQDNESEKSDLNTSNKSVEKSHVNEESDGETETCSFQSCCENDPEPKLNKKGTEEIVSEQDHNEVKLYMEISENKHLNQPHNTSGESNSGDEGAGKDDGSQAGSNYTLGEFCSEPLEILPLEERFEQFTKNIEGNDTSSEKGCDQVETSLEGNVSLVLENCLKHLEGNKAQDKESSEKQLEEPNTVPDQVMPESILQDNETSKATATPLKNLEEITSELEKGCEILVENLENTEMSSKDDQAQQANVLPANENESNKNDHQINEDLEDLAIGSGFEQLDRAIESETKSELFKAFEAVVKKMYEDCKEFSLAATDIDPRLATYMMDKVEILRALARRTGGICEATERACQTEPELSRRRLKKLNKKNKRALLQSSDSSSRSSSSSDGHESSSADEIDKSSKSKSKSLSQCEQTTTSVNEDKDITTTPAKVNSPMVIPRTDDEDIFMSSQLSQVSTLNTEAVYDDGVDLTKYLRSEVFSATAKTRDDEILVGSSPARSRSSVSPTLSSDDDASTKTKVKSGESKDKAKNKTKKRDSIDENDREIERLTNLDGLMKRHINAGASKQADSDKQKTKSQNQKNKTDGILEFLENDLPKEPLSSEESANENEEEVITEKQYLERYNQDLKNQLLNDSSNDTSQEEEDDDEFAPALSDESDSGNRSPLVDKFLKNYNIEDSEEEVVSDDATAKDTSATTAKVDEAKKPDDETEMKKEEIKENNEPHSAENSDCELLNDSFIYRKRTQPKSLEKILSEAEKRKKIQKLDEDLISLSSESDCSDVEAVEIEPAESAKSRAIKPMLRPDQLQRETLKAQKSENERIRRLEKRQAMLSKVLAENTEINKDEDLVLDYNEETKTFIKVHSELVKHLKPHQRDGVRFMYDSCYGGVDSSKRNHGSGCILAHCMGLGKTLQLITLMHTVISYKELKTQKILVLCPKSTVMNWGDEISRWLFPLRTRNLKVYTFNDTSDINEKLSIMREWSQSTHQKAGCLLIGYEAFRTLVFYHKYKKRNNLDSTRLEKIRDLIDEYLLQPGADLVVCDEGHIIKNSKSAISLAVAEIKTQKRIVLTGTPIQNNLKEYYSMVNFIKPLFLGTEKEFANLYANPIKNGQHKDSNKRDIKVMKQRSFVLHKKLSKFVQRKEAELLESFLPKKFEYVLFIPMTNVQNKLYECILEAITSRQDHRGRSLITDYTCLRKIWTHPKVLEDAWKNAINQQFKRDARKQPNSDDDQPDDVYDSTTGFMSVTNDWWRTLIAEKDLESILPSNKLRTMFEILRMCEENGDKCLIFSAFVAVLNVVEYFFKKLADGDKDILSELNMPQGTRSTWEPNKDYFRLDGKTSKTTRHEMIKRFNHPHNTRARVFLISAKAGGQGINLIGANRVIILDTSWNPSNDQQNIFRIFRLGQKKNCYIYRLLALGTMEEKVYSRSVTKQAMSFRVMDVQQIDRHYSMAELAELYTLTIPNYAERPTPIFPQDTILANLLRSYPDLVYKYHEHDSLLENKAEQELSEQEKIDAWNAYENDLQMNSQMANMEDMQNRMAQGNMPNYMGASGAIPGLNMQALLNFRSMNTQSSSSFMNPTLLQQYKYNMANQQYLDMVNNYRQFSTPEGAAAFNASIAAAYSSINSSIYSGAAPSVSPHHTGSSNISANTASHPLSALNDLSMYGLGINSGTTAAAVAAAATSLAQLPSTSTNANALYAAAGMQAQSGSTAGLYPNQTASFYQALQQLGYVGATPGSTNLLNNAALNSFTNSPSFQAPRRTPPQTASRKSSTPDMTGYRNSGGSISMPAATSTTASLPTMPIPTTTMTSMTTKPNELVKTTNNLNNNLISSNSNVNSKSSNEVTNPSARRNDASSSRATNKSKSTTSNPTASVGNINSTARTETTSTFSQNRQMIAPTSVATVTSTTKTTTTSKNISSRAGSKQSTNVTTTTSAPKAPDPQIRVKDLGQLCANNNRSAPLATVTATGSRDITSSNLSSNNTNSNNNTTGRSKQSVMDNRLMTATTSATAAELLKARSEMQIIPTTSPPGTASISKQLSEISPSISLTAVRSTNAKPNSTNSGNFGKISGANTNTTNSGKTGRVNSPATITHSTIMNRQQTSSPISQQRKNLANISTINVGSANLTGNAKKAPTIATVPTTSNLPNRKTVMPTPQSSLATTSTLSGSLVTNTKAGAKVSASNVVNNTTNSTVKYNFPAGVNSSMATITPAPTATTTTGKTISSILRNHQIRKMPSPLPTTLPTTGNTINNMNVSINSGQANSTGTPKQTFVSNTKAGVAVSSIAQAAQALFNTKNNTNVRKSSPTATVQKRSSRTASPANATPTFVEKNSVVGTGNRVNSATTSSPTQSVTSSAFPVHLQRSNSALGTTRTFSPLSTVKAAATGLGNRTKSSVAIVTPKITSVASLNNSTAPVVGSMTTASLSPAATAARVAAFKKLSNNGGKVNITAKQMQTAASSTLKAAAASSVVQQKRSNNIGGVGATQQQQAQPQLYKQRTSVQANGRPGIVGVNPTRLSTADAQLSAVNVRPVFKGVTSTTAGASTLPSGDKRTTVSSQLPSATGQAAMAKLLLERKRKASEALYKDCANQSKRPKDS